MLNKIVLLTIIFLIPALVQARSSQRLLLSGTVAEKIDFHLSYDAHKKMWVLHQKANGNLKATLLKEKSSSPYIVTVIAP